MLVVNLYGCFTLEYFWKILENHVFRFLALSEQHYIPTLFQYHAMFLGFCNFPQFSRESNLLCFLLFQDSASSAHSDRHRPICSQTCPMSDICGLYLF